MRMTAQAARVSMPGSAPDASPAVGSDLVARAARGEEDAWRILTEVYSRRVYAMIQARCQNPELSEEITQSVFCTLAMRLGGSGYTEQGKFEAWLFRIAMNRLRDEKRRSKRQATPTDPGVIGAIDPRRAEFAETSDSAGQLRERMREALETLSEADRTVIELRHHAGLEFKQISAILSQPVGTVLARHHRALKKLRPLLADFGGGDKP